MCLAVPGVVRRIEPRADESAPPMARVDFGGVWREVCLACVPEVEVGDWVVVHVGFAISKLDARAATLALRELSGRSACDAGERGSS